MVSRLLRFQLCDSTHHAVLHTLKLHHINPVPRLLKKDLSEVHHIDMDSLRSAMRKANSSGALLVLQWVRLLICHSVSANQAHSWWQFRTSCGAKVDHEVARHWQRLQWLMLTRQQRQVPHLLAQLTAQFTTAHVISGQRGHTDSRLQLLSYL